MSDKAIANLVDSAETISITGISFTQASDAIDFKFEPSVNLDSFLSVLIAERGISGAIDALKVNGSEGEAFKLIWDHLDDNYSYYNTTVNDAFIDLGIAYANYLKQGGEPLYDIVKYAPDSQADADALPERAQTLHDNILGNFDELSIVDKFGSGSGAILERVEAAGLQALIGERGDYTDGRPIFGGYDHQDSSATIEFDSNYFLI